MARLLLLVLFVSCIACVCRAQDYSYGQATFYDSISHGFCGYGADIPSNGFVAAWPFIETGPNGQGYPQPGGGECGVCFEVSCVPRYVESADGSVYLDRRDACADPNRAVVVKVVDECRCDLPRDSKLPRGNFNWCCNTPTPKLRVNRHIDLSKQAFTALVKDGNFGMGIIGIRYRRTSCSRIGVVRINNGGDASPSNSNNDSNSNSNNNNNNNPTQQPVVQASQAKPAAAAAAAKPPKRPTSPQKPSKGQTWHDSIQTVDAPSKTNTQSLPQLSQCGGTGGACNMFGGRYACGDIPFPGYACATGLMCERQNQYYWQCLPSRTNSKGGSSGSVKVLKEIEQCGGTGANCREYVTCEDKPFRGYACAEGLVCDRQNQYYYQCLLPRNTKASATSQQPLRILNKIDQCGGSGGNCRQFGVCQDAPFPGTACASGLQCKKQNQYYYECTQ